MELEVDSPTGSQLHISVWALRKPVILTCMLVIFFFYPDIEEKLLKCQKHLSPTNFDRTEAPLAPIKSEKAPKWRPAISSRV